MPASLTPRPRALVLAAGLGTRLAPLTDACPKPLLPVRGQPILVHTLRQLAAAGCEAAAVNLHHRGAQIRDALGTAIDGMPLIWSAEPLLLGTLGALGPLADFAAAADPLLIVNGDSLCRWPFAALLRRHRERGALATLLLATRADLAAFAGGVAIARDGSLAAFRRPAAGATVGDEAATRRRSGASIQSPLPVVAGAHLRWRVFAGAHAVSPRLLPRIAAILGARTPPVADFVRDLYEPLIAAEPGSIASLSTARRWHDLGTPRRFLAACLDWAAAASGDLASDPADGPPADGAGARVRGAGSWISSLAEVAPGAVIRRASIEAGCRVGPGARIEGSALLPGATVGAGCAVRDSLLGPLADLAAGGRLEGRLLAAGAASVAL